ncbi:protein [Lentinula edodes]|uniref:Protein n=1 Tax=Lentinula edodes TaxID=5353 RepID=A0A1Q3DY20_LENED|nr:uncharacterized protein C8R40DRAFT_885321 [Lentinula edodes]KAH7878098.1 hypothetical protein C8R40DRAFT_885321 [Lentinula edodes]GAV99881.1 protein [Lentinula edodes]
MSVVFLTFISLLSGLALVVAGLDSSSSCADTSSVVPFLRAYSSRLKDHFYTTNVSEMNNNALAGGVYAFEGESAFIWATPQTGTVPLFRLYNQNSTDHFYTMSSDELPEMMSLGWTNDTALNQTAGYVYPYSTCGAAPIYRLFNPSTIDHFYTMDVAESQNAVQVGYQDQGIAGFAILSSADGSSVQNSAVPYLLPSTITATPESQASPVSSSSCANSADAIPFLRAYASTGTDHFYTTNSTEMNNAQGSYSFEGDAAFLWSTQEASTVPLYRLFNQNLNDHFYTMDANESNEALSSGYAFDTDSHIAGYVYPYSICGASPIYRLYSSTLADHFYTLSQNESASAAGYALEGIAGFALLPSADGQPQTATVSASPLLLPVTLDPSPISISSTFVAAYSTTIDIDPVSTSAASNSGNKAIARRGVSGYGFLSVLVSGLVTAVA